MSFAATLADRCHGSEAQICFLAPDLFRAFVTLNSFNSRNGSNASCDVAVPREAHPCDAPTGRVHTPFVDGFLKKNYPGKEAEVFRKLSGASRRQETRS
eukprot:457511-Pleurochrysis_carterae.AAC.1